MHMKASHMFSLSFRNGNEFRVFHTYFVYLIGDQVYTILN